MSSKSLIEMKKLIITIFAVAFFLASWLVANVSIGGAVTWVSALFIVILSVPSYYFLVRWIGVEWGLILIVFFGIFPIIVEAIGITTGLPYGEFYYSDWMGFKIFGLVPWSVAFAFAPLIFGSLTISTKLVKDWKLQIILSATILVLVDMVLDPAAVVLSIWVWLTPGPYYGIPITNYTGWFLTAFIASLILYQTVRRINGDQFMIPIDVTSSLFISLAFWTGFSLWTGLLIPLGIGLILTIIIAYYLLKRNNV
ncbi:MAG: carotenoid biosynthesis protein [Candidatus Sifarchaeia archaeon]